MSGTAGFSGPAVRFVKAAFDGLMFTDEGRVAGYASVDEHAARFVGPRPATCVHCGHTGPKGIHVHGFTSRWMFTLRRGRLVRIQLHKGRWRCWKCRGTWHLRPPDEVRGVGVCSLVYVMFLWAALVYGRDRAYLELPESAGNVADVRTLARWHRRACAVSLETQQFIREAAIERSEPRPVERVFKNGLSPPAALLRRSWCVPCRVAQLWSSFAMLLESYESLHVPFTHSLARARAAADEHRKPFLS